MPFSYRFRAVGVHRHCHLQPSLRSIGGIEEIHILYAAGRKKKETVTPVARLTGCPSSSMATNNDYYNSPYYANPPRYDQVSSPPDPFGRHAATTPLSHVSPYAPSEPDVQHPAHSHQTLASDHSPYPAGGRGNEADSYSENIPLNSHAPYPYPNNPPPEWMRQPSHYPPSPEMGEPPVEGAGRRQKKGFFKKKLAWVTYTLTLIQIVVFIVELVKNGTYM